MTNHPEAGEKIFKKGEVIYQQGDYVSAIYDVLYGQVALYVDYHKPTQRLLNEVEADGFFGIVGFLESCPQNATAVALKRPRVPSSPTKISATISRSGPPRS